MDAQDQREGARDPMAFPISGKGRRRLLDTALRLFDERGVDDVSARTIAQEAGHRNVAAVSYHFGDKRELLLAVLSAKATEIDGLRHAALDDVEAAGPVSPRAALAAAYAPLIAQLDDLDGRRYVRLINQPGQPPAVLPRGQRPVRREPPPGGRVRRAAARPSRRRRPAAPGPGGDRDDALRVGPAGPADRCGRAADPAPADPGVHDDLLDAAEGKLRAWDPAQL